MTDTISPDEVTQALRSVLEILETERERLPQHGEPETSWLVLFEACYQPIIQRSPSTGRLTLKWRKDRPAGSLEHARRLTAAVTELLGDERGSRAEDVRAALRAVSSVHNDQGMRTT